jgi:hypothetical protein
MLIPSTAYDVLKTNSPCIRIAKMEKRVREDDRFAGNLRGHKKTWLRKGWKKSKNNKA